jgi:hypothetical protein
VIMSGVGRTFPSECDATLAVSLLLYRCLGRSVSNSVGRLYKSMVPLLLTQSTSDGVHLWPFR